MGDIISARKTLTSVDDVDFEDLYSELLATVKVPKPLKVTPEITLECPTKDQVAELLVATNDETAQKIIFGEHFEAAMALFGASPMHIWNKFMERYNAHFFGVADAGK